MDYSIAKKDPIGFYDHVLQQPIIEHKAKDKGNAEGRLRYHVDLTTKHTHRKVGRILMLVQDQLFESLRNHWSAHTLQAAFRDHRVMSVIQHHVQDRNIEIRDVNNAPMFKEEMSLIGKQGTRALDNASPKGGDCISHLEKTRLVSYSL